jgi:hypothetical protein
LKKHYQRKTADGGVAPPPICAEVGPPAAVQNGLYQGNSRIVAHKIVVWKATVFFISQRYKKN